MPLNDVSKLAGVATAFAPYLVERLKNESITLNDVSKLTTVVAPFVPYLVQATCSVPGATLHNRTSTTLNAWNFKGSSSPESKTVKWFLGDAVSTNTLTNITTPLAPHKAPHMYTHQSGRNRDGYAHHPHKLQRPSSYIPTKCTTLCLSICQTRRRGTGGGIGGQRILFVVGKRINVVVRNSFDVGINNALSFPSVARNVWIDLGKSLGHRLSIAWGC